MVHKQGLRTTPKGSNSAADGPPSHLEAEIRQLAEAKRQELIQQASQSGGRLRCGQVWGTSCRAWVQSPEFSHNNHAECSDHRLAAQHPRCPVPVLVYLAQSSDVRVRRAVIRNPHCPLTVLRQLAMRDQDSSVVGEALLHPQMPPEEYQAILQRADAGFIYHLAKRPECSSALLTAMAMSKRIFGGSLTSIARHPNCPPALLRAWVDAPITYGLSTAVASNPDCPLDILLRLLTHRVTRTRKAALENPNLPEEYRHLARMAM